MIDSSSAIKINILSYEIRNRSYEFREESRRHAF